MWGRGVGYDMPCWALRLAGDIWADILFRGLTNHDQGCRLLEHCGGAARRKWF
jgi:hypothetical protein